jgi:hypothetical protein
MPYESIPNSPGPSLPGAEEPDRPSTGVQTRLGEGGPEVSITADQRMSMENDAADAVFAKDLTMINSAAMAADVLGDLVMDDSAVAMADVTGGAYLRGSAATILVSEGPVDLQGGLAGLVIAKEFTVRDGGSVLMTEREAITFAAVFAGVLLGGWLLLRVLVPRR